MEEPKYIFVVGGVMSGIGKGVASSSIGRILKSKGFKVTAIKIDPYINVDAGTMNPTEHGEVFVLDDGYECDQDMGNYERFLDESLPSINYMTTGRVYLSVIERERNLEYKGKNVEVVPDIPLEVLRRIDEARCAAGAEITIVEIGGTIGEYQNIIFLEAARMLRQKHPRDVAVVMVSYVPIPRNIGEMKTKPTQYAARTLNSVGLQADIILARAEVPLDQKRKEKIAVFCNTLSEHVISAPDVDSIYDVPLNFEKDGMGNMLCDVLSLPRRSSDLSAWEKFVAKSKNGGKQANIAVVGKYFDSGEFVLSDSYISVLEALRHAAYSQDLKISITYFDSKAFESGKTPLEELKKYSGVLVPGGFGETGIEGKLKAIEYVRENKIPYLGLCYGMQLAVIEYARNVAGLAGANTTEVDKDTPHPVIAIMESQKENVEKSRLGGTMRLGAYPCSLADGTVVAQAYDKKEIRERHRHRYEVNPKYIEQLESAGLNFSGRSPDGVLMEIAELPKEKHPFFLGTQFHPEFLSRPLSPHPLFVAFLKAAGERA
ncbi:CTP synthase [Candidatus Adlerbacteria bacterium RIFCSPHIGHO2_01_FULL_54_23]|uniref:CTP synthase n=3 Tax=Candidatus Adleribacteriota TaxID=1752736 RepID=A0A1F4XZP8_9BACT|nr:MAG: CTP synthetase [Candidatus Adlerbacteria bacterium GW2011_GWA1_54_10]OGC79501.1 MAG: CTP synthase [Candidatus Adlerbacteria bacterium RIFCSPHIGHO2_01_FULL_54_23]OGC87149.1 MAG: CTP synthase [Candidatus Adlerbacteria bacterium RIFCSPLOWO2_01_FULL_54_16]